MDSIPLFSIALLILLIVATGVFVGSEYAVVKVRLSRIEQLVSEGNKNAKLVQKIVENLDYYLSTCQLGITVTALGLGWLGVRTAEWLLDPLLAGFDLPSSASVAIAVFIAFSIMTFLHVVIGELVPKSLAIQSTERMALLLARPLYWFGIVMAPLVWLLNGSARVILRIFGVQTVGYEQAHSEEELKIIMTQSYKSGEINQTELSYMQNIFSFDERVAKDIMVPRTQMDVISLDMTHDELLETIRENQFTRYPVTKEGDKDDILGFVNVKEMLTMYTYKKDLTACVVVHELPFVHDSAPIQDVLLIMQQNRVHMSIVIDEYGGTAGMITMEDILEEIVGEIRDEFDTDEVEDIRKLDDYTYLLNGRFLLSDLEERFGLEFEESEDVDTIGGWIQLQNTEITEGESVESFDHTFTVIEKEHHTIVQVRMTRNIELPDLAEAENH